MNEFKVEAKENGEGITLTVTQNGVSSQHFELPFDVCEQIWNIVQMEHYKEDVEEYLEQCPDLEDEPELSEEEIGEIVDTYKDYREDSDEYLQALETAVSDFLGQREVDMEEDIEEDMEEDMEENEDKDYLY